jgi:oligosaccharide repeat unit polymerase
MRSFRLKSLILFAVLMSVPMLLATLQDFQSILPPISSIIIVITTCIALCFFKVYPFSLRSTVLVFIYFFFGIIPLITYPNNIVYWGAPDFSSEDYFIANIVVLFFLTCFIFFDSIFGSCDSRQILITIKSINSKKSVSNKNISFVLVTTAILIFLLKFTIADFDIYSLMTGGRLGDGDIIQTNQIETLFLHWFITPILSICLIIQMLFRNGINRGVIILSIILFIAANPASMSRFSTGALYMPIVLISSFIFFKHAYISMLLIALIVVFPLLHFIRSPALYMSGSSGFADYWLSIFYSGDFDAYQSLMLVLKYDVVTYGYQLLGPLLFYLPRTIWTDKPIGSGEFLSERIGLSFGNISASFLTEGYVNFGILGVIIFGCALGSLTGKLDSHYWESSLEKKSIKMRVKYLYFVPATIFIMRGDLLSSISSLLGIIIAVECVFILVKRYINSRSLGC